MSSDFSRLCRSLAALIPSTVHKNFLFTAFPLRRYLMDFGSTVHIYLSYTSISCIHMSNSNQGKPSPSFSLDLKDRFLSTLCHHQHNGILRSHSNVDVIHKTNFRFVTHLTQCMGLNSWTLKLDLQGWPGINENDYWGEKV